MKKSSSHGKRWVWVAVAVLVAFAVFTFFFPFPGLQEGLEGEDSADIKEKKKGGTYIVPQFQQGPLDGPVNSNTSSVQSNTNLVTTDTNAQNDCYATNTCPKDKK